MSLGRRRGPSCGEPGETRQQEESWASWWPTSPCRRTASSPGRTTRPGGLGERGEVLHNWVMGGPWRYDGEGRRFAPLDVDRGVLQQVMGSIGAGIIGRRMLDVTGGWGATPRAAGTPGTSCSPTR